MGVDKCPSLSVIEKTFPWASMTFRQLVSKVFCSSIGSTPPGARLVSAKTVGDSGCTALMFQSFPRGAGGLPGPAKSLWGKKIKPAENKGQK
jgi:hypothetical protein